MESIVFRNFNLFVVQIVGSKNPNENAKKPESRDDENKSTI
jgi:hypothetical protein